MNNIKEIKIAMAQFEGRKFYAYNDNKSFDKGFDTYSDCICFIEDRSLVGYEPVLGFRMELGQYENSWSWLMPIVEKIEELYLHVQISSTNCFIHWMGAEPDDKKLLAILQSFKGIDVDGTTKIEAVFNACDQFIQWYKAGDI